MKEVNGASGESNVCKQIYPFCSIRGNILHQCTETEIRTLVIQNSF